ncbi:MAG: DNA repair protein RecO [Coriobacteriales bacterium]|jgi:DNA repair protein RecO (recombination protein O)
MPSYKTNAIVLKKTKLGETDLILTMLAENGSQIRAVAKGARKPGSTFSARLEPFSAATLMLHEGKNLDTITDVKSIASHEQCRRDLEHLSHGAVIGEFVEKTAFEGQENPVLFPLTIAALDALGEAELHQLPFVVAAFLLKAIAYLGFRPSFDDCTLCGERRIGGDGTFAISAGGWVCTSCSAFGDLEPDDIVDPALAAWLKALLGMRFVELPGAFPSPSPELETLGASLLEVCDRWIDVHLGLHLKSLRFLARI